MRGGRPAPGPVLTVGPAGVVGLLAALPFLPVLANGFFNYDDPALILDNQRLRALSLANLRWMFTTTHMTSYQPLSHLAYALIHAVAGLSPTAFHAASLSLHALNAALVYRVARRLLPDGQQAVLPCAAAALLWAVHPVQVQAVAWATALSDLLASSFALASVLAYLSHAQAPPGRPAALGASWALFAASALCRWKAAPLPLALLILDRFPLRRRAWAEKLPFLAVSAAAVWVNAAAKAQTSFALTLRPHEALARLLLHLAKVLWPSGLSPVYALEGSHNPLGLGLGACALLAGALAAAVALGARRWPAVPAALGAYVLFLLPPALATQPGPAFAYDFHAYLALVGLALALAAGLHAAASAQRGRARLWAPGAALTLAAGLAPATWAQARVWRESEGPWRQALAADPRAYAARNNLAAALAEKGRVDEALALTEEELALRPGDIVAAANLARLRRDGPALRRRALPPPDERAAP